MAISTATSLAQQSDDIRVGLQDLLDGYDLTVNFALLRNVTLSLSEYSMHLQFISMVPDADSILLTEDRVKMALQAITPIFMREWLPFRIVTEVGQTLSAEYLFDKAIRSNKGRLGELPCYEIIVSIDAKKP